MMIYIPTYEECIEIVNNNESGVFYESKFDIDGYNISMFNYRFAQYDNFENPIPSKPYIKAYEIRGITFVFNKDGSLYRRFLLLDKFFNLNQVPDTMYSVVKDYKIKNIMNKEDGSLASFIKLPNGKIIGRSKMSFQSDQAIRIQDIYNNNKSINNFVNLMMYKDIMPIFEYVAPTNRIVLKYKNEDLILIRLRDNKNGKYLDINKFSKYLDGINVANFENENTLDNLLELSNIEVDKEGWVVSMIDDKGKDKIIKLKTDWYFSRHNLFTSLLERENDIIKLILQDQIDDVISQLEDSDKDKIDMISNITDIINNYIHRGTNIVKTAMEDYNKFYNEIDSNIFTKEAYSKKKLALKYKRTEFFSTIMNTSNKINYDNIDDIIRDNIINKILSGTSRLIDARKWIDKYK